MLVEQGAIEEQDGGWVGDRSPGDHERARLDPRRHRGPHRPARGARARSAPTLLGHGPRASGPRRSASTTTSLPALGRRGSSPSSPSPRFSGRREFAFKHALTHEVAYATLPRVRAARAPPARGRVDPRRRPRPAGRDDRARRVPLRAGAPLAVAGRRARAAGVRRACSPQATQPCGGARTRSAERLLGRALELAPDGRRARAGAPAGGAGRRPHVANTSERSSGWTRSSRSRDRDRRRNLRADALGLEGARVAGFAVTGARRSSRPRRRSPRSRGCPSRRSSRARLRGCRRSRCCAALPIGRGRPPRARSRSHERRAKRRPRRTPGRTCSRCSSRRRSRPAGRGRLYAVDRARARGRRPRRGRCGQWSTTSGQPRFSGHSIPSRSVVSESGRRALGADWRPRRTSSTSQLSLAALLYVPAGRWAEADAVGGRRGSRGRDEPARLALARCRPRTAPGRPRARPTGTCPSYARRHSRARSLSASCRWLASPCRARFSPATRRTVRGSCRHRPRASGRRSHGRGFLGGFLVPIARSLAAIEDRDRLERLVRIVGEPVGETPTRRRSTVADGLLARLDGKAAEASTLLAAGAEELDAARSALRRGLRRSRTRAAALESGQAEIAWAARARASRRLLDPLGCVNPY